MSSQYRCYNVRLLLLCERVFLAS